MIFGVVEGYRGTIFCGVFFLLLFFGGGGGGSPRISGLYLGPFLRPRYRMGMFLGYHGAKKGC